MHKDPALTDLRVLLAVVQAGSLARAAEQLGLSPSAVSKRVTLLEAALGLRLLHRTTRRAVPTEDGETVHRWAGRIIGAMDGMRQELRAGDPALSGPLRIGTSSGFGRNHVAPVISELAARHPALDVRLEVFDRRVDPAAEGIDVDVRVGGVHDATLYGRRLAANQRVLCASPAYLDRHGRPGVPAELAAHRCLVIRERDQPYGFWHLQGPSGAEAVRVRGTLSTNFGEIAHRWALDGHGIVLRSLWDVAEGLRGGQLERVLPAFSQEADVWAVYPTRLSRAPKVDAFVRLLGDYLAGLG